MATILALSSKVARGSVGLNAIVPALHALGHHVIELPTVWLSNHPGHGSAARQVIEPAKLIEMFYELDEHGWLSGIDAVLTGYLPTKGHVEAASEMIGHVKRVASSPLIAIDPVCGDDPTGLYIEAAAAAVIRDRLIHSAHVMFPNRFELEYLSERPCDRIEDVIEAMSVFQPTVVVATSIARPDGELDTILFNRGDVQHASVKRRSKVPNGTGDMLSALVLGAWFHGGGWGKALTRAVEIVDAMLDASEGRDELAISELGRIVARTT